MPGGIAFQRAVFPFVQNFCFSVLKKFSSENYLPVFIYNSRWVILFCRHVLKFLMFLEDYPFFFDKAYHDLWRFEMHLHVKNRVAIESVTFVHFHVQECSFCFQDFTSVNCGLHVHDIFAGLGISVNWGKSTLWFRIYKLGMIFKLRNLRYYSK